MTSIFAHVIIIATAAAVLLVMRSTVRGIQADGARPWIPWLLRCVPIAVLVVGELGLVGFVTSDLIWPILGGVLAVLLWPDVATRLLGGYHPVAGLALQTLKIESAALRVQDLPSPEREKQLETIKRQLTELDRMRFSPEASEYIDGFEQLVSAVTSDVFNPNQEALLRRKAELEAAFLPQLLAIGASGRVLWWASPRRASPPS